MALGPARDLADIESLHPAHPLIAAAVAEARRAGAGAFRVRFRLGPHVAKELRQHRGARGRLALTRIAHRGFEREDRLSVTAVFEDAGVLHPAEAALDLLQQGCEDVGVFDPPLAVTAEHLDEVVEEELFLEQSAVAPADRSGFEVAMDQLDQFLADQVLVLRRARDERAKRLRRRRTSARPSDRRGQPGEGGGARG